MNFWDHFSPNFHMENMSCQDGEAEKPEKEAEDKRNPEDEVKAELTEATL